MNEAGIILILLTIIVSLTIILLQQRELRKTYNQLNQMLDEAIKGDFQEKLFDESQLSKIAVKLKRFLAAAFVSKRDIQIEKEAVKALISDISHQTKTPITNILLYIQLLKEEESLSTEGRTYAEMISGQSEKLDFLLQILVKTSRLETGIIAVKAEPGIINGAILTAISEVTKKAEDKSITLNFDFKEDFRAVFDFKWTTEAIYNILDNAVKYTAKGGGITVTAKDYEMFLRLDIVDTGIGITEEEYNLIFKRFYRGKAAALQEGVGLGLYLARKILMAEGGYIKVSSKEGEGSAFSLFFAKK